jgi:hypothetical protein
MFSALIEGKPLYQDCWQIHPLHSIFSHFSIIYSLFLVKNNNAENAKKAWRQYFS